MRTLSILIAFVVALLSASARANGPVIEVRLVVDSGGTQFQTQDGKGLRLGPPVVPSPFEVTQATVSGSEVQLVLAPATAKAFEDATAKNQGRQLAIIIDRVVQGAPVIKAPIKGGKVSVTLRSPEKAQQLAKAITAK
jgi:preprotein translocase subunit SecD